MKVLVTGARGYVGTALVPRLAGGGHEVVAFGRRDGDVRDADALRGAVRGVDAVCHLAALTRVRESLERPEEYHAVNADGTAALVLALTGEAARRGAPLRVVYASTAAVYGVPAVQPITEDAVPRPTNPYGESKLAGERELARGGADGRLGAVSLRVFNVAGAADPDRSRIIPKALAVAAGHAPELVINGDGTAVRDFVHVDDVARAFVLALGACRPGSPRTYNVGATRASVREIVAAAERITARPVPARYGPPADEPPLLAADTRRVRDELGWRPERSDLDQIIADAWEAAPKLIN